MSTTVFAEQVFAEMITSRQASSAPVIAARRVPSGTPGGASSAPAVAYPLICGGIPGSTKRVPGLTRNSGWVARFGR